MLTPRENETLIGHEAAEQVLIDAAVSERLAHAWLLTGPRGIGKATLAYRFARYLLAQGERVEGAAAHPISLALDPSNPVFRRIAAGGHADLRTVERTVNVRTGRMREEIVVDDVRGAGAFLRLTPAEGGWRVVIIDSADELNQSAANAVLKVLEEPPERAVLILVSQSPARLLATIRSRCRRLVLRPLAETEVAGLLEGPCPELSAEERGALARLSEGSPGRAFDLARAGGLKLYRDMIDLLDGLPRLDIGALEAIAGSAAGRGDNTTFETVIELYRWWLVRLVRSAASAAAPPEVVAGEGALIRRLTTGARLDRLSEVWEKVDTLFGRAESANLDRRQVIMSAFLALEDAARA